MALVPLNEMSNALKLVTLSIVCSVFYMLSGFKFYSLVQFGVYLCSGVWQYMTMKLKQRKIPDCTKGKIESQYLHNHNIANI